MHIDRSMERPVKYRCKLERAHNEEPFNNAFDLNRNVMKIITSLPRPGDAPINGRSAIQPSSPFTLPSVHSFPLSLSLVVSYLRVIGRGSLSLTRFCGQTTNLSEVAVQNASGRAARFVRKANVENEAFIDARRTTFPPLLSPLHPPRLSAKIFFFRRELF